MAQIIKVAVIQLYPKPMQIEHNFNKAASYIRSAAQQGAELAVLPEYHLTNWVPKDPGFVGLCEKAGEYLERYQALAREVGICIVPGTIVEVVGGKEGDEGEGEGREGVKEKGDVGGGDDDNEAGFGDVDVGKEKEKDKDKELGEKTLVNVCYFIDHEGRITGKYVKKNLWGPERAHLTGSGRDSHPVLDTPIGKVGLLICWDLAFPEAFRELIAQGAKLIIIPTFWTLNDCSDAGRNLNPSAEALFLDSMLTARAFENTCAIVFANAGGPPGRGYAGLSQVTVPFVGPLTRLGGCAEGMSIVDVDMQILEHAEENYKIRADIASESWHYDYRHSRMKPKEKL